MTILRALACLGAMASMLATGAAWADPVAGLWRTEPDRKDLISHIRLAPCGPRICGVVESVYDSQGRPTTTPSVGRQLFWGLSPRGQGRYAGGSVHLPMVNLTADLSMEMQGNARLRVTACKGLVCRSQTWTRLR